MLRLFIKMGEYFPRLLRDYGYFVIFACKLTDSVQRIEQHDGDEFNFLTDLTAKQLNAPEAANVAILNAGEDLLFEQRLILV